MLGYYAQDHCAKNFQIHKKQFPSSMGRLEHNIIDMEAEFLEKMTTISEGGGTLLKQQII